MAELFDKDRRTITRHIYKDEELKENSVCSFFKHTAIDLIMNFLND